MTEREIVTKLAGERDRFLAFLRSRVGSSELAEDLLQVAYVNALHGAGALRDGENAVAWFWRVVRNAVTDLYRHRDAEKRALERQRNWAEADEPAALELRDAICQCIDGVLDTLQADEAALIRRVDLQGAPVRDAARAAGITANNAAVRLHRARKALRERLRETCGACADHGCLDCGCRRRKM